MDYKIQKQKKNFVHKKYRIKIPTVHESEQIDFVHPCREPLPKHDLEINYRPLHPCIHYGDVMGFIIILHQSNTQA